MENLEGVTRTLDNDTTAGAKHIGEGAICPQAIASCP